MPINVLSAGMLPAAIAALLAALSIVCACVTQTADGAVPSWATSQPAHFELSQSAPPSLAPTSFSNSLLEFHKGGSIETTPEVHVIFWGSNIETTEAGREVQSSLTYLFEHLSGTEYQEILLQYFNEEEISIGFHLYENGHVGPSITTATYVDKSVSAPSELRYTSQITEEVKRLIEEHGWSTGANAQYMVVTAPGTSYYNNGAELLSETCAWHGTLNVAAATVAYDFVPYQGDKPLSEDGCIETGNPSKNPVIKTSKSASHEYAEAATDPYVNAWYTLEGPSDSEISDRCSSNNDFQLPNGSWVQELYSDNTPSKYSGCVRVGNKPAYIYTSTEQATCTTKEGKEYVVLKGQYDAEGGKFQSLFYWLMGSTPELLSSVQILKAANIALKSWTLEVPVTYHTIYYELGGLKEGELGVKEPGEGTTASLVMVINCP